MATITTDELRESISKILKGADLDSLSSKKVRKLLEDQYQEDLTERKQLIDQIVMEMVTAGQKDNGADTDGDQDSAGSAESEKEEEEELSESGEYSPPPKKKAKTSSRKKAEEKQDKKRPARESESDASDDSEIDDEALARKLQEEERKSRSRAVKKTQANKKESKRGGGGGGGGGDEGKIKKKKENTYTRKCVLSNELADVVGAFEMARHDVVKKMWAIVRERNLFDPSNKQFAICDEQLYRVFGTKRVRMFGMMKYLKNHIKDPK